MVCNWLFLCFCRWLTTCPLYANPLIGDIYFKRWLAFKFDLTKMFLSLLFISCIYSWNILISQYLVPYLPCFTSQIVLYFTKNHRTPLLLARSLNSFYRYIDGLVQDCSNGPFARYVKLRVTHAPGMPGMFSPSSRVSDPDMQHGTCVTHVPWCMPESLTSDFLWSRWRGKTFPAFPVHAHPQWASYKRPIPVR